jgi:hypothetical protein
MASIPLPIQYETETQGITHHASGAVNMINRNPLLGPEFEGFPGNAVPVIEMETAGHVFVTADEAEALGVRLIQHAAVLRLG